MIKKPMFEAITATVFIGGLITLANLEIAKNNRERVKNVKREIDLATQIFKRAQMKVIQDIHAGKHDSGFASVLQGMIDEIDFQNIAIREESNNA